MKIRVVNVDQYGLNGREHHPEKTDEGKVGHVFQVHSEAYLGSEPLTADEIKAKPRVLQSDLFHLIKFYETILEDGTHRTFASYEVEIMQ